MSKASKPQPSAFEQFVQKVAAVPKEAVEEAEAQRKNRSKPRRFRIKAKK